MTTIYCLTKNYKCFMTEQEYNELKYDCLPFGLNGVEKRIIYTSEFIVQTKSRILNSPLADKEKIELFDMLVQTISEII